MKQLYINNKGFDLKNVLQIAEQLLKSIEYMHEKGYIHRNITFQNISIGHGDK